MVSATDGKVDGGGGVDRFRIKIWDRLTDGIIYDNQLCDAEDADAANAIEGGNINIARVHELVLKTLILRAKGMILECTRARIVVIVNGAKAN